MTENMENATVSEEQLPVTDFAQEPIPVLEFSQPEAPTVAAEPQQVAYAAEPAVSKPQKLRKVKKPRSAGLKFLMGLIAFILCSAMFFMLIAGTMLLDLRVITSKGGIERIINQLLRPTASYQIAPSMAAQVYMSGSGSDAQIQAGGASSELIGPLVDWTYEMLEQQFGDETSITKSQVEEFITNSTASDFLADKMAGVMNDFYNDTSETTITPEEVADLLRDNKELIQETFDVEITEENIQQIQTELESNEELQKFQEEGFVQILEDAMDDAMGAEGAGMMGQMQTIKDTMAIIRQVTSYETIATIGGGILLIMILLFFVNGTVPKTLSDIGIVLLVAGLLVSAANIVNDAGVLKELLAGETMILGLIDSLLSSVAIVHYSILGAGVAFILAAIIAKIIKSSRAKKQMIPAL